MAVVAVGAVVGVVTAQPFFSRALQSDPGDTPQEWHVLCRVPLESHLPLPGEVRGLPAGGDLYAESQRVIGIDTQGEKERGISRQ